MIKRPEMESYSPSQVMPTLKAISGMVIGID